MAPRPLDPQVAFFPGLPGIFNRKSLFFSLMERGRMSKARRTKLPPMQVSKRSSVTQLPPTSEGARQPPRQEISSSNVFSNRFGRLGLVLG